MKWHLGQMVEIYPLRNIAMVTRLTETLVCVTSPCARWGDASTSDKVHAITASVEQRFRRDGTAFVVTDKAYHIRPIPCRMSRLLWELFEKAVRLSDPA